MGALCSACGFEGPEDGNALAVKAAGTACPRIIEKQPGNAWAKGVVMKTQVRGPPVTANAEMSEWMG